MVSRFHDEAPAETAATVLSVANQSKTLSVVVLAPCLGYAIDSLARSTSGIMAFLPLAVVGCLFAVAGAWLNRTHATASA
jgi:hypothetical protein